MITDKMKHGPRPSHKGLKPFGSSSSAGGRKHHLTTEHIPSSSGVTTERDTTSDSEGSPEGYPDCHEGVIGSKENAVLRYAEQLMYIWTLFVDPFPNVLKLNAWVLDVWREGEKELAKVEQSPKSRGLVRGTLTLKELEVN